MDREELKRLLETPLDPNLDYFDATGSIEALAEHLRDQHKLIKYLTESLVMQASSIIALRKENVEIKADLLAAGIASTKGESELVGFDEPSIITAPRKPR
jgi:hypothetical protein